MNSCTHQRTTEEYVQDEEEEYPYGRRGEWKRTTVSTTVDLDTHRYKCTQCGQIMYYSGAAADFYERGIRRGPFAP